ncbi:hypothetical protein DDB_G0288601 [Dictyostelium discoideum AX4]|uniref:Uncharacterized protein n=1 Tax=Dictyostelium discoideum TaxID=44689 RepID=Q54IQ4_DICDI|nr:hypothetical protein DDB_G0288601 [Dictyostelium discoideum AX4]EAL63160.1 hypothetical protein DDB_G0288601 [Dictyostelium discoideum AX4]|eukprot:XP_636660.1 hypothetical protein DDB_G0288601 [Dictyostelium discoideum AX4]
MISQVLKFKGIVYKVQISELRIKISRDLLMELIFEKLMENAKLNKELELLKNEIHEIKNSLK